MELKILSEKDNKTIGRKEIRFEIAYPEAPPKKTGVRDALADQIKADPKNTVVVKVQNAFGLRKSVGQAHVYSNPEDVKKYETKYILKRMGLTGEKKEETKPTEEAPKEEKPAEVKEEAKEEPKEKKNEGGQ